MKQLIVVVLCGVMLSACSSHDKTYYLAHPKAIEQAIRHCNRVEMTASCSELRDLGEQLNQLGYELQLNQQHYGQTILALQQARLAESAPHARKELEEQLQLRLAVVNWLASPGRSQ